MERRQETTVGERVRQVLSVKGWSQATLAEIAHIPTSYLSRLLSGKRRWTPPYVEAVARALELPEERLVSGTDVASLVVTPKLGASTEEMSSLLHKLSETEARLGEAQGEAARLISQNAELSTELGRTNIELVRLQDERRAEREELEAERVRGAFARDKIAHLTADIEGLESTKQRIRGLVEVLGDRVKAQYQTLTARDVEVEHFRREIRGLHAELAAMHKHGEEVEQEIAHQRARIAWVRGSETSAQALAMLHGYAARILTNRLEASEDELSKRDRLIQELTAELERRRAELGEAAAPADLKSEAPRLPDRPASETKEPPPLPEAPETSKSAAA